MPWQSQAKLFPRPFTAHKQDVPHSWFKARRTVCGTGNHRWYFFDVGQIQLNFRTQILCQKKHIMSIEQLSRVVAKIKIMFLKCIGRCSKNYSFSLQERKKNTSILHVMKLRYVLNNCLAQTHQASKCQSSGRNSPPPLSIPCHCFKSYCNVFECSPSFVRFFSTLNKMYFA